MRTTLQKLGVGLALALCACAALLLPGLMGGTDSTSLTTQSLFPVPGAGSEATEPTAAPTEITLPAPTEQPETEAVPASEAVTEPAAILPVPPTPRPT